MPFSFLFYWAHHGLPVICYLCVVKPALHQKYVKLKTIAIGLSVSWLRCPIIHTLTSFVSSAVGIYDERRTFCIYEYHMKVAVEAVNFCTIATAFILGLLIFLAYFKVFRFVSNHNNTVSSNLQEANNLHTEAKITKTLVFVVLGFVSLWVPVTLIFNLLILLDSPNFTNSRCQFWFYASYHMHIC